MIAVRGVRLRLEEYRKNASSSERDIVEAYSRLGPGARISLTAVH